MSAIEWTDETWNPVVGCTKVSPGCANCYAERMSKRLAFMSIADDAKTGAKPTRKDHHLKVINLETSHWNNKVVCIPEALSDPLHWKGPRKIFVNSMSDLFHKDVPFDFIDQVFAVMALCPQHTFQILTKRPERMAEYLHSKACPMDPGRWTIISEIAAHKGKIVWDPRGSNPVNYYSVPGPLLDVSDRRIWPGWPLPNVWLGTSVEDQKRADERIPHLLKCPAAVRFLSCEPLLGEIDLRLDCAWFRYATCPPLKNLLKWVIVGGESGPHSRACDVASIREIVKQCKDAGVPVFVKQLGANIFGGMDPDSPTGKPGERFVVINCDWKMVVKDRKGGKPEEWPEDLRVREMPEVMS